MKLGLSMACYRWELYPNLQRTRTEYMAAGNPVLYFSSVPVALPLEEGGLEWLIDHCGELGLSTLYMFSQKLRDLSYAATIRERANRLGLEIILASNFDWASTGKDAEMEREKYVERFRIANALGVRIVNVTHSDPLRKNHYTKNPSIDEQIERMKQNFAHLAIMAEEMNLILALENHTDYRCSEIAHVLRAVNSRALRACFDTGNPVNVIEDPVEAAKTIAPFTVVAHLKDYHIMNMHAIDGAMRVFHAPTGQGDLDLPRMLDILHGSAPDPNNLPLCIESVPPLDVDPGLWVRKCLSNTRELFGKYLT